MIYLVYGTPQELLIEKQIKKIIKETNKEIDENSYLTFSLDETPIEQIIDECLMPSFFSDTKIIVVKNAYYFQNSKTKVEKEKLDALKKYLENPSSFTTLIFVVAGLIDDKKEITQTLKEHAQLIKIDNVDKQDWPQVISQLIDQYKLDFNDDAKKEFIDRVSGDLTIITNELKKLRLYGSKITLEVVKKLVPAQLEDKLLEMVDSILSNDLNKTLKIYNDLKILNEDPIRIISVLSSQFRFMYEVGYLAEQGMGNDEIAKEFNNVKPGRIYYTLKKIGNHNINDILDILDELATLDYEIKAGNVDKFRAFELFIVKDH